MVDEFDLAEFLHMLVDHCVDLLGVEAAGVLLADQRGGVRTAAASSERAELLEVFAADTDGGPCVECVRTGVPVVSTDLAAEAHRWPRYAAAAALCGYRAVHALPMRLRREVIGALSLLGTETDGVDPTSIRLGQALADVATIGILQQRDIERADLVTEQLRTALDSRVVIEQAKGMLAAHSDLTPEKAFTALRAYARTHHHRLSDLARQVVDGTTRTSTIITRPPTHHDRERSRVSSESTGAERLTNALHHRAHLSVGSLAYVRRLLTRWATSVGLDSDTTHAVVLSGYEALANAVEHAYLGQDGGEVELHATREGGEVTVVVVDHGRWQIPSPRPVRRGRGLVLIRGLSARADVSSTAHGTTVTMTWLLDPN